MRIAKVCHLPSLKSVHFFEAKRNLTKLIKRRNGGKEIALFIIRSRGQWNLGKDYSLFTRIHTHTDIPTRSVPPFVKRDRMKGDNERVNALLLIAELNNGKWRKALILFSPQCIHHMLHAHTYLYTNARARAHVHFRGQEDDANLSVSLPPHDTDDQDRARAIRTRRWRRQLFCGTNRARAPRPWRTYSTPSWGCHPRRVPRVLARGDPS